MTQDMGISIDFMTNTNYLNNRASTSVYFINYNDSGFGFNDNSRFDPFY